MREKILKDASNRLERYAWCLTHPWNNKLIFAKTLNSLFFLEDNKDENVIDINTVEYEYIRDFISDCTYFSVLSFDTPRHSFNSLLDFESILEPLIILYSKDKDIQEHELEEVSKENISNNLFNIKTPNYNLKAKYIIGAFDFCKGGYPKKILLAEDFLLVDSIENLENSSFYKMNLHYSESINLNSNESHILLSDENRIMELNVANLLNDYTKNDFYTHNLVNLDSIVFYNNSVVLAGEKFSEGYLTESHYAASIWIDINKKFVLHKKISDSRYNGK